MPLERKSGDFGLRLREARERKGVSLREIANATKISIRALDALEKNDISLLPGGIFSRAFVRSYAVQAGLDPEKTVEDFVQSFPHESVTAGHPPSALVDDGDSIESDRRVASLVIRLAAVSIPIVGLVLYFGMVSPRAPVVDVAPASSQASAGLSAGSTTPAAGQVDHLTIELVASGPCVISATIDSQPPIDLQLQAAGHRTLEVGHELILTVSDPAAIAWTINGEPARGLGPPGDAATVHVTIDNYRDFLNIR